MADAGGDYFPSVLKKVKLCDNFAEVSAKEHEKLARELTDHKQIFNRFSHLLEVVDEEIQAVLRDEEAGFTHSDEVQRAHQRAKHGMARVCHLPVKLFLSRLRQHTLPATSITAKISEVLLDFGALHAGLLVGNIRVEWGTDSLIDPQWEDEEYIEEDFVAHIHHQGDWALTASEFDKKISLADRERRVNDKIDLILESAEQKRQLIINLVELIVQYNRTKHYCLRKCNCQHFVTDAMRALGIKKLPEFSGQLNDYLQKLKSYVVDIPEEFNNHATLDAHVKQRLEADTLTQHDMEYLLLLYYRLHMDSAHAEHADADNDNWKCTVDTCQYEYLADKVNRQAMLCHQFLRRHEARGVQKPMGLPTISESEDPPDHLQIRSIAIASDSGVTVGAVSRTN